MTPPKFTLHTRRPRRRIRWDGPAATLAYAIITWGAFLGSIYFIARCAPAAWRVIMGGGA